MDQITAERIARALESIANSLSFLTDKGLLAILQAKQRELGQPVVRSVVPSPGTAAE